MENECVYVEAKTAGMASSMTISSSPIEAVDIAGYNLVQPNGTPTTEEVGWKKESR
tara:strand:+ start:860 stop:1027 length:168 start_codon:yes stop_codon:yes gene_type:complete